MPRLTSYVMPLLAVVSLSGCSSCGEASSPIDEEVARLETLHEGVNDAMLAIICKRVFECPTLSSDTERAWYGRYADRAACAESGARVIQVDRLATAVREGQLAVDEPALRACVTRWRESAEQTDACATAIPDADALDGVCSEALRGLVKLGGACAKTEECAGTGTFCKKGLAAEPCYGRCTEKLNQCAPACGPDEHCVRRGADNVCEPLRGVGESCFSLTPVCARGLVCKQTFDEEGGQQPLCQVPVIAQEGMPCGATSPCAPGLRCRGTCEAAPTLGRGEPCGFASYPMGLLAMCAPGLVCTELQPSGDGAMGVCGDPVAEGGACASPVECELGLDCVGAGRDAFAAGVCVLFYGPRCTCLDDPTLNVSRCYGERCGDQPACEVP